MDIKKLIRVFALNRTTGTTGLSAFMVQVDSKRAESTQAWMHFHALQAFDCLGCPQQ